MQYIMVKGGGATFCRLQSHAGSKAIRIYIATNTTCTKDVMLGVKETTPTNGTF